MPAINHLAIHCFIGWLTKEDCNAISVDWSILGQGTYQEVAEKNVPIVGATTGAFINFLYKHGTPIRSFHLVGFSMGV